MKTGITAFTRRVKGLAGSNRVFWKPEDIERLAQLYNVPTKKAFEIAGSEVPVLKAVVGSPITKSDTDLPTRWKFIASDGSRDRAGDIIDVKGIDLAHFRKVPAWFLQHHYDKQIGISVEHSTTSGAFRSTLDLGVDIFPEAPAVQRGLATGMLRGCSIGFDPIKWRPMSDGDGIFFEEVSIREVSVVTLPCLPTAICIGPEKSLKEKAAQYRKQAAEDRAYVAEAKRKEELEAYIARTTPEQRRREREATLLRIRGRS